ncbi:hypothetical protein GCM10011361_25540 [Muriicola marianensis]|uniref:Cytochrome c domain-containing protein n=2 Tax=Muriicola marianensis TaxID=1324801 RepID=A0ABQ1R4I7_9FLAO|nr:hypothetical protein GCM10011361_25540 [Muriicola marianensis]
MKKMKKRISFFLMSSLILFNFSCYYDQEIDLSQPLPDIPVDQTISFSTDIEPIFAKSGKDCTACHNGNVANPDLQAGNAYADIISQIVPGDAEGSTFYQRLPGNGHPLDVGFVMDNADIALIKAWIDRGAENN